MAYEEMNSHVDVSLIRAVDGSFFASLSSPVDFILVRHGESDGNAAGLFQGRQDCPLSALGRSQAAARGRAVAKFIRGDALDARNREAVVFCSPLLRARESAEIIAREAGIAPPRVEAALIELDTGSWTGRSWTEIRAQEPETWRRFQGLSWEAVQDAESSEALFERALRAWTNLRAAAAEGARTVVAVSHGGFLQWLIRSTFGCRSWFPLLPAHNCGASRLRVEPATEDRAYISWKTLDEKIEGEEST